jgi:hypothetical protein
MLEGGAVVNRFKMVLDAGLLDFAATYSTMYKCRLFCVNPVDTHDALSQAPAFTPLVLVIF